METNRQLEEIMSWRFITEFWRRFPKHFYLIEGHPGGGQYDCLVLMTRGKNSPRFAIDVNRGGGSVHIHMNAFGLGDDMTLHSDWLSRMLQPTPKFLDEIAQEVRLVPPKHLPTSTPTTIVYRFISDFLTHTMGRLERWECRNGYLDTSGDGGGKRHHLFEKFPGLRKEENLRKIEPFYGEYAYNFWFLLKNDVPVLCLDTSGITYRRDGSSYDLGHLYKGNRKIWPLIFEVARDILP
jgi:hypothetical protein